VVALSDRAVALNYRAVVQTVDQLRDIENSPSISMWRYLVDSDKMPMVNSISIYMDRGDTPQRARIYYMNAVAYDLWISMGKQAEVIGQMHRPPKSAQLIFGSPFSE